MDPPDGGEFARSQDESIFKSAENIFLRRVAAVFYAALYFYQSQVQHREEKFLFPAGGRRMFRRVSR
jgi:hypothetical protein